MHLRRFSIASALLLSLFLTPGSSRADDGWDGRILTLMWENDATAGSDKHYTQGARISYLSADDEVPGWISRTSEFIPALGYEIGAQKYGVAISQEIYTPEDLRNPNLIPNDRPYAGWLYGTATIQRRGTTLSGFPVMEHIRLDLGVIGPESLAEETQKSWHGVQPEGWSHQLKTEPGLNVRYDRSYLFRARSEGSHWAGDMIPMFDTSLGNVLTYFQLGSNFRFGYNLPNEFAVTRNEGSAFGAYFFTRVQGRLVLRNIFLDGNSFRESHSVDKRFLVGDLRAGITLVFKRLELSAAHTVVSEEFAGQHGLDSYGTATFTVKF